MNHIFYRIGILMICCCIGFACEQKRADPPKIVIVKIMPEYPFDEASDELYYWTKQKILFPQIDVPDPLPKGVPHDDSLLTVSLGGDGNIMLNSETVGDLRNVVALRIMLRDIFRQRNDNKVFEPESSKVVTVTSFRGSRRAKFGDVMTVIETIKASGADPIFLQIDDPPE